MHDKFGETFQVINRATVDAAYGRNVWEETAQAICSLDFVARNDEIRERMRDTHWDLVVVDEAHKMAAYRYGTKTRTTARYELGAFLAERTDHYLFLTATPHKGDPDNFALLLQLLDPDLYVTGDILAEASDRDENRIMVRRLKEDMRKFNGEPCFLPRHVETLSYRLKGSDNAEAAQATGTGVRLTVAVQPVALRLGLQRGKPSSSGRTAGSGHAAAAGVKSAVAMRKTPFLAGSAEFMGCGAIGSTSDSGSEGSRFES